MTGARLRSVSTRVRGLPHRRGREFKGPSSGKNSGTGGLDCMCRRRWEKEAGKVPGFWLECPVEAVPFLEVGKHRKRGRLWEKKEFSFEHAFKCLRGFQVETTPKRMGKFSHHTAADTFSGGQESCANTKCSFCTTPYVLRTCSLAESSRWLSEVGAGTSPLHS